MPALLTSTSICSYRSSIWAATLRTSLMSARSPMKTSTFASGATLWMRSTVASALVGLRATMPTRLPRRATSRAAASPIPFVAPVMTMTFPASAIGRGASRSRTLVAKPALWRWDPRPVAGAALEAVAAVGEQVVAIRAHTRQVPQSSEALVADFDDPVMDLQLGGGPTARMHAGVAVALVDGGAKHLGDVAAGVGNLGDVDAVVEHDLDEGVGQDGPDGLRDGHSARPDGLTPPLLAPQA